MFVLKPDINFNGVCKGIISNRFSDFSKSLMIEFMRSHYYDSVVAQYVHPKMNP